MKKTVLITGATGAIGKATALELAKNGCSVILLGRNADRLPGDNISASDPECIFPG